MVRGLSGVDAQTFTDVVDEACSPLIRYRRILLIETDDDGSSLLGTGDPRLPPKDTKEMSQGFAQDLRPQRNPPEVIPNTSLL